MQMPRRKTVYICAWIAFGLSLISGSVIADAIAFSRQLNAGGVTRYGFVSILFFILGFFTNLILLASWIILKSPRPSFGWRVLLIGSVINNAAIGACFYGGYLRDPAYWLWLLAFVAATWSLLWLPADPAADGAEPPKTRSPKKKPLFKDDAVPVLLWAWLACTLFWIGVMIVSFIHPAKLVAASALPKPLTRLTSYVDDLAQVMPRSEAARIDASLARFEKETSNQIAVVVFPEAPAADTQ